MSEQEIPVEEMIERYKRTYTPAIAVADYLFDVDKARRMLGWEPRWGNVEAVVDTYRADFESTGGA